MSLAPGSSRIGLWSGNLLDSATRALQGLFGHTDFSPEEALVETPNIDPRLIPRVPMNANDIDVHLLSELGKLGLKRGKLITAQSHPELMQAWQVMSQRAGLKKPPQLILTESKTVNALTVSPEEVVVTTSLLKLLDLRELTAVLGHELGHVSSDHKKPRVLATLLFGGGGTLAGSYLWNRANVHRWSRRSPLLGAIDELVGATIGGFLGCIIANQIAVRPTELEADTKGAAISGDPQGLISALTKLEASRAHNPVARFFAYLQSGYPSTEHRIRNLETIAKQMPAPAIPQASPAHAVQIAASPGRTVSHVAADARMELAATPELSLN